MDYNKKHNRWQNFYNSIKDDAWPECVNEHEFRNLPHHIQEAVMERGGKNYLTIDPNGVKEYKYIPTFERVEIDDNVFDLEYNIASDFTVYFNKKIFGHGISHSHFYPRAIEYLYGDRKFNKGMEWCAGAGFIGFRLLSDGICNSMTFVDVYEPALNALEKTWDNRPDRLTNASMNLMLSSKIADIGNDKYDLIVANPPNFDNGQGHNRKTQDPNAEIHKEFFLNIKKNLSDDGIILIAKNVNGHQPWDFADSITSGGLTLRRFITFAEWPMFYFVEVTL